MAQALRSEHVTPADELRDLLAITEKRVANLKGSGAAALRLLEEMDRVAELWPTLEAQGVDLRPEAGRWETIQMALRHAAPRLVREIRVVGGLPAARAQHHPDGDAAWWWNLAEAVRRRNVRLALRSAIVLAGVAVAAFALVSLLRLLFPVDPNYEKSLSAITDGEQKIADAADYAAALVDFERAAELAPGNSDAWLRVGATLRYLGDEARARDADRRAQVLLADDVEFWLSRTGTYLSLGMYDEALADIGYILEADPENALAYYYMSSVYEERGQLAEAVSALQMAADLADRSGQAELTALARYRLGIIVQQSAIRSAPQATSTP